MSKRYCDNSCQKKNSFDKSFKDKNIDCHKHFWFKTNDIKFWQ